MNKTYYPCIFLIYKMILTDESYLEAVKNGGFPCGKKLYSQIPCAKLLSDMMISIKYSG